MQRVYPSLISADLLNLQHEIERLDPHCPGYHLDIMDNHFVPNLTWGHDFINEISRASSSDYMWTHLMVDNPSSFLDRLLLPEGSAVTFHIESNIDPIKITNKIIEKKWRPSIAISPKTGLSDIFSLLDTIDHVLLMSVEPGHSGQSFLEDVIEKIDALANYRRENELPFTIALDGGINRNNIVALGTLGVDEFAVASGIFNQDEPVEALKELNLMVS